MNRVGKHIALIAAAFVLSTDGKRLARRPPGNQLDAILPLLKLNVAHIFVEQVQIAPHCPMPVFRKSLTRILVALNNHNRVKSRLMQTKGEASTAGK